MTRIIAVSSGKGGVGKTMTTANLGMVLASVYKKKVVVIDCNLTNPHLGLSLGMFSVWPVTLNNVLSNEASIEQAVYTHATGLRIIPAAFESKDLKRLHLGRLRSRMQDLFKEYGADIVLLDSSPGLTQETLLTFRCADEVIFVATPHIPSIIDITKCCQHLQSMEAKPLGIVLNRIRGKKYEMDEEEIAKFTSLPIIGRVPEDENVLKATNFKAPVITAFPQSSASKAYLQLAASLVGQPEIPVHAGWAQKIRGWFH